MNDATVQAKQSQESLVGEIADEFLRRQENGEHPDVEEYAARHPEAAELLRNVLRSLKVLELSGAENAAASPEEPAPQDLGDFRLLREIGRGGMGIVYEAEQLSLGRRVALKVLPFAATMDTRQLQRFQNEARAAAGLHHTNIVPVYFVGSERGVHYYAMQFIEGQDLASAVTQLRAQAGHKAIAPRPAETVDAPAGQPAASPTAATRPIAGLSTEHSTRPAEYFRTVARLGIQAAEALDHAHQQGILHRDVKPANLMVDAAGQLWITDFGLARIQSDTQLTMTGDLLGTLRYMSPEQALAKRVVVDHRTDIYSLGATLYELLTLEPVFTGRDRQELLRQIAFEEPVAPRRVNRAVPAELETIVLKATEKNPADRYTTAQEVADDLERFLKDEAIHARRPTLFQRGRKWGRRHKSVVGSAAAALLIVLTVVAGSLGWILRNRAARVAETERGVVATLEEADGLQAARRIPEALAKVQQAAKILASGAPTPALEKRVRARLADLKLIVELEDLRVQARLALLQSYAEPEQMQIQQAANDLQLKEFYAATDRSYGEAFRAVDMDLEHLSVEEAAHILRTKTVAVELAAALDDWSAAAKEGRSGDPRWKQLLTIACAIDADPLRTRVRKALADDDLASLKEFGETLTADDLAPATVLVLANALAAKDANAEAIVLLTKAQFRYRSDFWINLSLGYAKRDPAEAIRFITAALAARPDASNLLNYLGVALANRGQVDDAIAAFREAIRLQPKTGQARMNLAAVYESQKKWQHAIAIYREWTTIKPDDAFANKRLASLLPLATPPNEISDDPRKAIRSALKALDAVPVDDQEPVNDALWHALDRATTLGIRQNPNGAWQPVIDARDKATEMSLVEKRHLIQAMAHWLLGDTDAARASFCKGSLSMWGLDQQRPRNAIPYRDALANLMGITLRTNNRLEYQIGTSREIVRLEPDDFNSRIYLAELLSRNKDVEEAFIHFKEAIRLSGKEDPKHGMTYNRLQNLATALHQNNDVEGAIYAYNELLKMKPKDAYIRTSLGIVLRDKKNDLAGAIREFREAIQVDNSSHHAVVAHCELGKALLQSNDVEGAIREYKEAVRIGPREAASHEQLARLLADAPEQRLREPKAAVEAAQKAVVLEPKKTAYLVTLGQCQYRNGDWKAALDALKEAQKHGPGQARLSFFLAMTQWQLGDQDTARTSYQKGLQWLEKNKKALNYQEFLGYGEEAAELLGIPNPKPASQEPPGSTK